MWRSVFVGGCVKEQVEGCVFILFVFLFLRSGILCWVNSKCSMRIASLADVISNRAPLMVRSMIDCMVEVNPAHGPRSSSQSTVLSSGYLSTRPTSTSEDERCWSAITSRAHDSPLGVRGGEFENDVVSVRDGGEGWEVGRRTSWVCFLDMVILEVRAVFFGLSESDECFDDVLMSEVSGSGWCGWDKSPRSGLSKLKLVTLIMIQTPALRFYPRDLHNSHNPYQFKSSTSTLSRQASR